MKSPTGLYCANSQKRTESLLLPSSPTIQADLSAKAGTSDEDAASEMQYSRTSPLPLSGTAFLQVDLCITPSTERGHAARDALRHIRGSAFTLVVNQRPISSASPVFNGVGTSMLKCSSSR